MATPATETTGVEASIDWASELTTHRRWLRTVLVARLREHHSVEEVMQEVALAAVSQSKPLRDRTRVGAWLYRVALRQVLLFRRKRGRQARFHAQVAERVTQAVCDPLSWLLEGERLQLLRKALEKLDSSDREILLLKYSEEWSGQQLAQHLGVSLSCIEARLHRARQRLREMMG
jgi:RNA polymerase sigma-70 factor (ECF subfamily)